MRRVAVLMTLSLAVAGMAVHATTPSFVPASSEVARALLMQTSGSAAALVDATSSPRVLRAGDLDGDGLTDAMIASVTAPAGGAPEATVRAYAAGGEPLWQLDPIPVKDLLDGAMWIVAELSLDDDGSADALLVTSDLATSSVIAVSGADGHELWRDEAPGVVGTASNAQLGVAAYLGFAVPLAPAADLNLDGFDDLLVGRYSGAQVDASSIAWTLRATLLSGADGSVLGTWEAVGVGVAPTATIADLDGWGYFAGFDVLVADGVRTPAGTQVTVRAYSSTAPPPFTNVAPTLFTTSAPATMRDVAVTLTPLAGEAFQAGGFAVGFAAAGPFGDPRRGAITGPTSLVGLGRGGIERFRITLPSSSVVQWMGDLNHDEAQDVRTVRVEGDSLMVETWSGHGNNVALLPAHQMTYLEGDDYTKLVDVHPEMRDADGDGLRELLIGGGYGCGPRYQIIGGNGGGPAWGRQELRSIVCFGRLFAAGMSLGGANEDVVDWTTQWACCIFGPSPAAVEVRARHGMTGAELWVASPEGVAHAAGMNGTPIGDVTGDGLSELLVVFRSGLDEQIAVFAIALDAATGEELWRASW